MPLRAVETRLRARTRFRRSAGNVGGALALAVLVLPLGAQATPTSSSAVLNGPSTPILDSFDGRGLEDPLYQWGNWATTSIDGSGPTLEILGGGASHNEGDAVEADSYRTADAMGAVEAYATIAAAPENNQDLFVYINLQDVGTAGWDGYRARWFHWIATDGLYLEKVVDGQATSMVPPVQLDPAIGDTILIRNNGGTIELWHETGGSWTLRLSKADGGFQGGKIGLGANDDSGVWDDFGGSGETTPPPTPPAVPATGFVDQFDRPNEDPLSQAGAWSATPLFGTGQTLEVLGGAAGQNEGETVQADSFRTAEITGDAEVHARIANVPNNNQWFHLYLHLQEAGTAGVDGYRASWFHWISTDGLYLQKIENGVAATIAGPLAVDPAGGDTLLLRRFGLQLELWRRSGSTWTKHLSTLDGSFTSGRLGLGMDDDDGKWDDFGGGAIGVPPPPPPPPAANAPPVEQTFGATQNEEGVHGRCGCGLFADPVSSRTGAFATAVDDLDVPGTGVPFSWGRSYTSADSTAGRLGPGWTDSYSASLAVQTNGDVRLHGEDGQQLVYARQADGSFLGAPGALSTLTQVGAGYELLRADQVAYRFDSEGRLLSVRDRNGQGVALTYDGQGRLATVTDASGRGAAVSHDADGLVSRVQTQDGRSVRYGYTSGRLSSVIDVSGETWAYAYDAAGRLTTVRDPLGHVQVTNVYGADGRVRSQSDALGETTSFGWNEAIEVATATDARGGVWTHDYDDGVLVEQVDPLQSETRLVRDEDLNATSVTGPSDETTSMTYDGAGNVLTVTAPASLGSARKTFVYNERNDPVRVTDARGKVTEYAYELQHGNLTSATQDGTRVASYTYDGAGRVVTYTDANEGVWSYEYTAAGLLAASRDPLGNTTSYTYDGAGRVVRHVDPKGHVPGCGCEAAFTSRFTYDEAGRRLSQTNPLGHTSRSEYDAAGRLASSIDALGRTTSYSYDDANRLLAETSPDPDGSGPLPAPVTSFTYDEVGNTLTETDPRGGRTLFAYDVANRLVTVTGSDPDGAGPLAAPVTTHTYDESGNLVATVEPRGNDAGANPGEYRTTYTRDAAGRVLTQTRPDPDGAGGPQIAPTTTNAYDSVGNLRSVRDGNGHVTSYTHDAAGRIVTVVAPDLGVTTYGYDDAGNLSSTRDDAGHVTSLDYDAAGNLLSETSPDPDRTGPRTSAVTSHAYDANGNRVTTTDANGNATPGAADGTTTYRYDEANRLVGIDYSDATPDVTFALDAVGNRISMTDGVGAETRTYDGLDRVLTVARGGATFSYGYDGASNVTRRSAPGGVVADYAYDGLNRIAAVSSGGQQTTYGYDAASNLLRTALPAANGYVEDRVYDRAGRLVDVTTRRGASVLAGFSATLDPVGNVTQLVRTGSLAETRTYAYDANDRLISVCFRAGGCSGAGDPLIRWTYDHVGNRLTEQRPDGTTTYTYDARDRLLAAGSTTFAHDQNGNVTRKGARTFAFDLANRMVSTTQGNSTTTYDYDGDDKRIQAAAGPQASRKTRFVWDVGFGLPRLAIEQDGAGSILRRYVHGVRPISLTAGGSTSYYVHDGLGSVANLTSASGATQWTWAYDPFGGARTEQRASGRQPTNPLRFTGEYLDPTDLYHLRARQYDPALGRFLRPDPVDTGAGSVAVAGYVYAGNRPTVMVDPSGEVFRWADAGSAWAGFSTALVDWRYPSDRCLSSLCGPRRRPPPTLSLVHPVPRGYATWGGTYLHRTDGLAGYPAFDYGGASGTPVVAVERGYVREFGDAQIGDALYLRGDSGVDYWYGHIRRLATRGQRVRMGQVVGRTVRHFNGDHLHLGANANIGGEIIGRQRAGTDNAAHPTWRRGVEIMRQISRAPRV